MVKSTVAESPWSRKSKSVKQAKEAIVLWQVN
jgi:hypothetical protein